MKTPKEMADAINRLDTSDTKMTPNQQKILEAFDEKFIKELSIAATIGTGHSYNQFLANVKSFLAQSLQETESEGYLRGLRAAREVVPEERGKIPNVTLKKNIGFNACRQATLEAIEGLIGEGV